MRLIILAGFSKTDASGNPDTSSTLTIQGVAVAGTEQARALANTFAAAKQQRKIEPGVSWLGLCHCEPSEVAVVLESKPQVAAPEQAKPAPKKSK